MDSIAPRPAKRHDYNGFSDPTLLLVHVQQPRMNVEANKIV